MDSFCRLLKFTIVLAVLLLTSAGPSAAQERLSYFRTIVIEPGIYKGSLTCVACGIIVKGEVEGEVVAVGGDIIVYGKVKNDVVASGGAVHLKNGSEVTRDVVAIGGLITYEGNVATPGREGYTSLPWFHLPGQRSIGWRGALTLFAFQIVCVLVPVALFRPRRVRNVAQASRRWLRTGLVGAAVLIGFSFGFDWMDDHLADNSGTFEAIGGILFLLLLAIGISGISLALGERFFRGQIFKALAAGTLLLTVLELLPIVGFVAIVAVCCWGIGAALWSALGFRASNSPGKISASSELKLTG